MANYETCETRIDDMIGALKRAWLQHPELRLGQLISGASYFDASGQNVGQVAPLFWIGDDEILNGLRGLLVVGHE